MCCLPERKLKTESTQTNQKPNWQKAKFKSCFWFVFLLRVQIRESFSRETRYLFYTPHSTRAFLFTTTYTYKHISKQKISKHKRDEFGKLSSKSVHASSNLFSQGKMSAPSAISPISKSKVAFDLLPIYVGFGRTK